MALEPDLYLISVAARILGMHPQTLRKYERLGLVQPSRTVGSMFTGVTGVTGPLSHAPTPRTTARSGQRMPP